MNRRARTLSTSALTLVGLTLVACGGKQVEHAGDVNSIRWNNSPAMQSLAKRSSDNLNTLSITKDTELRMFWEDGARALYIDRPTKLTPKPMMH